MNRLINIWKERQVLPPNTMEEICSIPTVEIGIIKKEEPKPTFQPPPNTSVPVPVPVKSKIPDSFEVSFYSFFQ